MYPIYLYIYIYPPTPGGGTRQRTLLHPGLDCSSEDAFSVACGWNRAQVLRLGAPGERLRVGAPGERVREEEKKRFSLELHPAVRKHGFWKRTRRGEEDFYCRQETDRQRQRQRQRQKERKTERQKERKKERKERNRRRESDRNKRRERERGKEREKDMEGKRPSASQQERERERERDVKIQPSVQLYVYSIVVFMYNDLVLYNAPWIKGLEPSLVEPKDSCQEENNTEACTNKRQTNSC